MTELLHVEQLVTDPAVERFDERVLHGDLSAIKSYFSIAGSDSDLLVSHLQAAGDPNSPNFLGAYPAELKPLVERTLGAARPLSSTAQAIADQRCFDEDTESCRSLNGKWFVDATDLEDALKAWGPYVGSSG